MKNSDKKYFSLWICIAIVGIFVVQLLFSGFTNSFILTSRALIEPWRFVTAIFLHSSLLHLLYNLFSLIFFGLILENLIGSKKFLMLFIVSGIFANILSFSFYPSALGASGAIMALIGCVAVLRPMMVVWAFGIILPMFALAIIWVIASILGIFGLGEQNIGYLAHLSGILIVILYGLYGITIMDNPIFQKIREKIRPVKNSTSGY